MRCIQSSACRCVRDCQRQERRAGGSPRVSARKPRRLGSSPAPACAMQHTAVDLLGRGQAGPVYRVGRRARPKLRAHAIPQGLDAIGAVPIYRVVDNALVEPAKGNHISLPAAPSATTQAPPIDSQHLGQLPAPARQPAARAEGHSLAKGAACLGAPVRPSFATASRGACVVGCSLTIETKGGSNAPWGRQSKFWVCKHTQFEQSSQQGAWSGAGAGERGQQVRGGRGV